MLCSACNTVFETEVALYNHLAISEKCLRAVDFEFCTFKGCNAKFRRRSNLRKHQREVHGKVIRRKKFAKKTKVEKPEEAGESKEDDKSMDGNKPQDVDKSQPNEVENPNEVKSDSFTEDDEPTEANKPTGSDKSTETDEVTDARVIPTVQTIVLPIPGVLCDPPPNRDVISIRQIVPNTVPPEHKVAKFFEAVRHNVARTIEKAFMQFRPLIFDLGIRTRLLQGPAFINGKANIFEVKTFEAVDIKLFTPVMIQRTLDIVFRLIVDECAKEVNKCELNTILDCQLCFCHLKPPIGRYIPVNPAYLPPSAVVNIQNADSYCFKWAILAGLSEDSVYLPVITYYGIANIYADKIQYRGLTLDFSQINIPMEVRDMYLFERNNPKLSVNVFGVLDPDNQCYIVGPLYRTSMEKEHHINLLYFEMMGRNYNHFATIKSLLSVMKIQMPRMLRDAYDICNGCLAYFTSKYEFEKHRMLFCHFYAGSLASQFNINPEPVRASQLPERQPAAHLFEPDSAPEPFQDGPWRNRPQVIYLLIEPDPDFAPQPTQMVPASQPMQPEPAQPQPMEPGPAPQVMEPGPAPQVMEPGPAPQAVEPGPVPQAMVPGPAPQPMKAEPTPQAMKPEPVPQAMEPGPAPQALEPKPVPQVMEPEPAPQAMEPKPDPQVMEPGTTPQPIETKPALQPLKAEPTPQLMVPEPVPHPMEPEPASQPIQLVPAPLLMKAEPASQPIEAETIPKLVQQAEQPNPNITAQPSKKKSAHQNLEPASATQPMKPESAQPFLLPGPSKSKTTLKSSKKKATHAKRREPDSTSQLMEPDSTHRTSEPIIRPKRESVPETSEPDSTSEPVESESAARSSESEAASEPSESNA